jgi:hypothetical protein
MKTKLLLASLAMSTCAVSAWAGSVVEGDYLLQNVETGYYLGGGNDWGTHASLLGKPQWFTIAAVADTTTYTLDSHQYNNATSHYLGSGLYVDAAAEGWTITENEDGTVVLDNAGKYLSGNGKNATVTTVDDKTAASAQWKLISKADIIASQENASYENPVDVTAFILNPEFKRNASTSYYPTWTVTAFDGTGTPANYAFGSSAATANCGESYHSANGFAMSQEIKGLKSGYYKLGACAFYREDGGDNPQTVYPYIFANDKQAAFPLKTGNEGSMAEAYTSFLAGNYAVDPITVKVKEDETLTIGVKGEATDKWNIWGEFTLTYLGANSVSEKAYLAAVESVQTFLAGEHKVNAALLATLKSVYDEKGALNDATDDEFDAATSALNAALNEVSANEAAYATFVESYKAMEDVVSTTNVYSESGLKTYREPYDNAWAAYEAGVLTTAEANAVVNPHAIAGWHSANTVDDLLLELWGQKEYDGSLYINTWSTEGTTDGTNFLVPFFEYWTGDANTLGEKTWTATVSGLNPELVYNVEAWVRVRYSNGQTVAPYGIYLQVGESKDSTDVCAGEAISGGQFYIGKFTASGAPDKDGNLKINFLIAAENNVSWLSFKNVVYNETDIPTAIEAVNAKEENASLSIYDLSGRKLNSLKKGINIVNGAKVLVK